MKTLMLSTALVTATAFGAMAQDVGTTPGGNAQGMVPAFLSSEFTGMSLYTLDTEDARALRDQRDGDLSVADRDRMRWTSSETFVSQRDSWEDVGSINDIVMTQDGEFRGILIDVGGFLGLGARTVMVDFEDLYFVADDGGMLDDAAAEDINDFFVVISMSEEELENLPEWDETQLDAGFEMRNYGAGGAAMTDETAGMETDRVVTEMDTAETETDLTEMEADTTEMADSETGVVETEMETASGSQGDMEVFDDNYAMLDVEERTAERLIGAEVYDSTGANIGNVDDVLLGDGAQVTGILVDVGGFLGLGEHTVNLPLDQAEIGWNEGNNDVRVLVTVTAEELEAMPEYEG